MRKGSIYQEILKNKAEQKKLFALLIDPDKLSGDKVMRIVEKAVKSRVDLFFIGSSLLVNNDFESCIETIKNNCSIPALIFPGNGLQLSNKADGILFLSLISGRNAEMLIGKHVIAAPYLRNSSLEVLPTGYILVESGKPTAVSYMSNTTPIPSDKNDIAMCTAIAGELLGLKLIFMDAGSGAKNPVHASMISEVSKNISVPLIVGGGISTPERAVANCQAGADIIVVGNSVESDDSLIGKIADSIHHME